MKTGRKETIGREAHVQATAYSLQPSCFPLVPPASHLFSMLELLPAVLWWQSDPIIRRLPTGEAVRFRISITKGSLRRLFEMIWKLSPDMCRTDSSYPYVNIQPDWSVFSTLLRSDPSSPARSIQASSTVSSRCCSRLSTKRVEKLLDCTMAMSPV